MAQELSSNWKKLQAKIKAESSAPASSLSKRTVAKRKAAASASAPPGPKRQKLDKPAAARKQTTKRSPQTWRSDDDVNSAPAETTAHGTPMGVTQSSTVTRGTAVTITPSLALWAEDNDISPEDLAEAYNLGVKDNALLRPGVAASRKSTLSASSAAATAATAATVTATLDEDRARANEGLAPADVIASLGRYVAIDCEMVGVGPEGRESALVRVTIVDFHGRQVYDSLVAPRAHQRVTDFRTRVTGLRGMRDLAGARDFATVRAEVAELLLAHGRVLVGHDVRHDLAALELLGEFPAERVRDTARFSGYRRYGHGPKPALRVLAREVLGVEIQSGAHSSLEDVRVAMLLFRRRKPEFDVEHAAKYGRASRSGGDGQGKDKEKDKTKAKAKKKKKKKKK